jgi:hypothetical protein
MSRGRKPKANTTSRGLGHAHRERVKQLQQAHTDGTPCWWCGLPMFRDRMRNPDQQPLHGDHTVPRAYGGTGADRLLHGSCNSQRGDGSHDYTRPAVRDQATVERSQDHPSLGDLAMGWPTL